MISRPIPSSKEKEQLPVIGLGTWSTFDVSAAALEPLKEVLHEMHAAGGRLIDSSPMYGNAETVIGELGKGLSYRDELFYATKVWTTGKDAGIMQMGDSFRKMKRTTMDLMQIHNLVDWKTHLKTLRAWKDAGKIRYIGITHYTDSMHGELEKVIRDEPIDFVQFNYSLFARNAENNLLPLAADRGVATLINRPFGEGKHFALVKHKALPEWATERGINSWSQLFLLYIISHPAVTCVIPATSNAVHAKENFATGGLSLADESVRLMMRELVSGL